jgi:preprotein translocase subunit SecG
MDPYKDNADPKHRRRELFLQSGVHENLHKILIWLRKAFTAILMYMANKIKYRYVPVEQTGIFK